MSTPGPSTAVPPDPVHDPGPAGLSGSKRPSLIWAYAMPAALLAGLVPFLVGEAAPPPFVARTETVPQNGQKFVRPVFGGLDAVERKTGILVFGVLGATLALALGLSGGLARGSLSTGLRAAAVGIALGAGVGAGAAAVLVPISQRHLARSVDVNGEFAFPMMIQVGIWAALGTASGVALGLGAGAGRRLPSVVVGGLIGGALGALVYEVASAVLIPGGKTYRPIAPDWPARLLAATACPILVAALATYALLTPSEEART